MKESDVINLYGSVARVVPVLFLLLFCCAALGFEERPERHALIIANSEYTWSPLRNPINDGEAMAEALSQLGIPVTRLFNTSRRDLHQGVVDFYNGLAGFPAGSNKIALVYYAGHAVQIEHRNYLVPLDVRYGDPALFLSSLYDLNELLAQIPKDGLTQSVVILDACRNNPFPEQGSGAVVIRDGLAPLRAPAGTLIAYATEPGNVAADGGGKNGLYTKHLLRHIDRQVPVEEVFRRVRKGVSRESRGRQVPWEHSSLINELFIDPPPNQSIPDLPVF